MSLLDEFTEEFCIMDRRTVSDGESGFVSIWSEGAHFRMPQAHEMTIQAQMAEREGTASTYSFLPPKGLVFDFHDVFKRLSDGAVFRVTSPSGEKYTPASSALNRSYILAEKWSLT